MGSCLAPKLSGFGCRVIAYDRYKTGFTNQFVEESEPGDVYAGDGDFEHSYSADF